jgi:hypothetical protein
MLMINGREFDLRSTLHLSMSLSERRFFTLTVGSDDLISTTLGVNRIGGFPMSRRALQRWKAKTQLVKVSAKA